MFYKCMRQFKMPRYEAEMWYTILRGSIWKDCERYNEYNDTVRLQNGNDYIEISRSELVVNFNKLIPEGEIDYVS